jgi:hypothetical protein
MTNVQRLEHQGNRRDLPIYKTWSHEMTNLGERNINSPSNMYSPGHKYPRGAKVPLFFFQQYYVYTIPNEV